MALSEQRSKSERIEAMQRSRRKGEAVKGDGSMVGELVKCLYSDWANI